MQTIEEYLYGEFRQEKSRLKDIYDTLVEIAKFFCQSYKTTWKGWYYEVPGRLSNKWYSYSTQALCAFALNRLTTATFWHERDDKEQNVCKVIKQQKEDCIQELCNRLNLNVQKKKTLWESSTYGKEDPLTAAWIVELCSDHELCSLEPEIKEKLQGTIQQALNGKFDQIIGNENRAGAHAFLVYRLVSAVKKIQQDVSKWKSKWKMTKEKWEPLLSNAGYWFEKELYRQLSHYHFSDFRFDAPELIYSLAGALQTNRLRREDPLIREVLEVIRAAQQRSVYWRPYRPFVVKPQGLALMPLSVEVADALLGTWELTSHLDQLKKSLTDYYEWLMTQRIEKGIGEDSNVIKVIGWRSENAFGPPEVETIHSWTTSRVAVFLLNYSKLLDRSLQSSLLKNSGLSFKEAGDLTAWDSIQPMDLGREKQKQVMQLIKEHFITPHEDTINSEDRLNPRGSFSMFLSGPPGTSKTSIAEGLAEKLGLKLVTITISDFIMLGVEAVEQRAKIIFDVLGELKNVVVLFDEIDRLITDRDSDRYLQQGDVLQLMTPSMLAKLNDLKRKRKLLFVISTNYFERIDRAIKRPGRIDQHFLILPFDQTSRVALLNNFIGKYYKEPGKKDEDWKLREDNEIAKLNPLLIFEEWKRVFDKATSELGKGDINSLLKNLETEIQKVSPSISVRYYDSKFADKRTDYEKPYREFFFLCFLLAEAGRVNDELSGSFKTQWNEWKKKNAPEVDELTSDEWVKRQLKGLGITVKESHQESKDRGVTHEP
jgi:hypothetical protein